MLKSWCRRFDHFLNLGSDHQAHLWTSFDCDTIRGPRLLWNVKGVRNQLDQLDCSAALSSRE